MTLIFRQIFRQNDKNAENAKKTPLNFNIRVMTGVF